MGRGAWRVEREGSREKIGHGQRCVRLALCTAVGGGNSEEKIMADFRKRSVDDMAADNPDVDAGTSGSTQIVDWNQQNEYWRDNYGTRPYTQADRAYSYYQPAYKYGHESAFLYGNRAWDDEIASDLARGWEQARGDSTCTWDDVKDAVRDAYERSRGVAA